MTDSRDKPLEAVCYTPSGRVAHFTVGEYHLSTTTYCGAVDYRLPRTDDEWKHVNKLPTCRRCEEILRPVPKNFTYTVKVEITGDNTVILHNGGELPVTSRHEIMARALWLNDPTQIRSIESFPYDKGEGWAKYRTHKIKEL